MPIPDFQSIMLPLLKFAEDEKEHSIREAINYISRFFQLTNQERKELLASGQQTVIANRTGWARTYLKKAGLLEYSKRGHLRITERGLDVLERNPSKINMKFLEQFPEYVQFKTLKKERKAPQQRLLQTPQELIEEGYQRIQGELAQELLQLVKNSPPGFFEKLVVELLIKMGYGGSLKDAGMAIGMSGDEGVDGIIKEDKLGLDSIYIQAKRWEATVGRPQIQNFVGALKGRKGKKGIFITTSSFSREATDYTEKIDDPRIILIDGENLAQLMIDNDIGVSRVATYDVKKIDRDYFSEE